jgi:hypothetical protein
MLMAVFYRDSWSRVCGFSKAKSAKVYANGLGEIEN